MRSVLCLVLACLSFAAVAQDTQPPHQGNPQESPPPATQQDVSQEAPVQVKPTEPRGFPGLPPRNGSLPLPQPPGESDNKLHILQAGKISRSGNTVTLADGAKAQYRGYDIIAKEIVGDLDTQIFDATGDVHVQGKDADITGDHVRINFVDKTYRAWDANAQIQPPLLAGQLQSPLYSKSKLSYGSQREIFTFDSEFTTCNYLDPHFYIAAKRTVIRPNKRVIFHDMQLWVLHHKILSLPFLSVPLNQPTYRYVPEVGQDPQDGYYIKTRFGIPLNNPSNNLDARLDYFQKRGQGIGGDYSYAGKAVAGLLSAYGLLGLNKTVTLNTQHQQQFKWGSMNLDANYQQNNFQSAPGEKLLNTRLQFNLPRGLNNTGLSLYQANSSSTGFSSTQQTITLTDTRTYDPLLHSNLNLSMVSNDSGAVKQQQVNVDLTADDDVKKALAHFEYQRSIPVGTVENFFNTSDKTPVMTVSSDATRLLGPRAPKNLPFTTDVSLGEFVDPVNNGHITRSAFDLGFQRLDNSMKRAHFTMDGRFNQGIYSDNTAQYTVGLNTLASYSIGPDTGLNLRYNYIRPYGFAPLIIDQTGNTNLISGDLSYRPFRPFLIGVQSGYDLEALRLRTQTPYQFVGVRTEYTPRNWFSLRTQENYDPIQRIWNSARVDIAYRPGATFVSIGAQYDGQRQVWGSTNLFIDGLTWGRLRMSTLLQYNGYIKQFQTQQFSFTYDLHCAEAVLQILNNNTGFNSGRQIVFFLRIKALPFQSPFGVGSLGQALGTGGGVRF